MTEEAAQQPEEQQPDDMGAQVKNALGGFPGAPEQVDIDAWKGQHGDVYVSALSESEIFIFRSLNRLEYRELQERAAQEQLDAMQYEDNTVKQCVLWSSVDDLSAKAGTIPTLLEMIMQNSNFVPPQIAATLVAKL